MKSEEIEQRKREQTNQWYESLSEASIGYDNVFDSKITYIGAGVIALTIAFATRESITPYIYQELLMIGIGLSALAVIGNLASFPISKIIARHYQNIVHNYIETNYLADLNPSIDEQEKSMYRIILYLNLTCFGMLSVGIILLSLYIFKNL